MRDWVYQDMKVAIYGNRRQERFLHRLQDFFVTLKRRGLEAYVDSDFAAYLSECGVATPGAHSVDEFPDGVTVVISIGGDGTFLRAAQWTADRETPILGINTGHLGFLASYSLDEVDELARVIVARIGVAEKRMLLKVSGEDMPEGMWPYVLNEVAVVKGDTMSMVDVKAYIDDYFVADYLADGLVISTPTGSTAYNLSAGGPILEPTLHNMILQPIAPHSLTLRPLVIGAGSKVCLHISSRGAECHVGLDGRTFSLPGSGAKLMVERAPFCINVLRRQNTDFATILRKKLLWGKRESED